MSKPELKFTKSETVPKDHIKKIDFFSHADQSWFGGVFDARGKIHRIEGKPQILVTSIHPSVANNIVALYGGYVRTKKPEWADWICPRRNMIKVIEDLLLWSRKDGSLLLITLMELKNEERSSGSTAKRRRTKQT